MSALVVILKLKIHLLFDSEGFVFNRIFKPIHRRLFYQLTKDIHKQSKQEFYRQYNLEFDVAKKYRIPMIKATLAGDYKELERLDNRMNLELLDLISEEEIDKMIQTMECCQEYSH